MKKNYLTHCFTNNENELDEDKSYMQWISTDRITINTLTSTIEKYINLLSKKSISITSTSFKLNLIFQNTKKKLFHRMKQLNYLILLKIINSSSKLLFRDFTGKTPMQLLTLLMFTSGIQMEIYKMKSFVLFQII